MKRKLIILITITLIVILGCAREGITDIEHWSSGIPGNTADVTITANVSNFKVTFEYKDNDKFLVNYKIEKEVTGTQVTLEKIPHGTYKVTVLKSGYKPFTNSNFSVQSVTVNQNVSMTAVATVNINLTTNNGGSVNGAVVKLQHNTNSSITQQKTATSGTLSFTDMEYGTYTITVTHTNYNTHTNTNFIVQSATVNQNVNLAVLKANTVNINLSTNNSGSVNGAVVKLQHNTISSITQQKTATSVTVSFTDMDYGTYTLTVSHTNYKPFTNSNFSVQSATVNQNITMTEYKIGDTGPAGGKIFYDKGSVTNGWRYLEAAPADEGTAQWGAYGSDVSGTSTAIGSGKANTQAIITRLQQLGETGRAAQLCNNKTLNGYSDWFLPSKDELNEMYKQRTAIGGFQDSWYWSSSQFNYSYAWYQNFLNGSQSYYAKDSACRVRAVRAF